MDFASIVLLCYVDPKYATAAAAGKSGNTKCCNSPQARWDNENEGVRWANALFQRQMGTFQRVAGAIKTIAAGIPVSRTDSTMDVLHSCSIRIRTFFWSGGAPGRGGGAARQESAPISCVRGGSIGRWVWTWGGGGARANGRATIPSSWLGLTFPATVHGGAGWPAYNMGLVVGLPRGCFSVAGHNEGVRAFARGR